MTNSWSDVWIFRTELYNFFASYLLEWIKEEEDKVLKPAFWQNFPLEAANPQIDSGLEQLINCTTALEALGAKEGFEKVSVEYTELFIGTARPKAPLIESYYYSNKRAIFDQKTIEMKRLFTEHGMESVSRDKYPEDHLGLQLSFLAERTSHLHLLDPESQRTSVEAQIEFIDNHLLSWLPGLYNDTKEHGTAGFYSGLIELIWGTVVWDRELLKEFVESHDYAS